jgi:hypothetical protein
VDAATALSTHTSLEHGEAVRFTISEAECRPTCSWTTADCGFPGSDTVLMPSSWRLIGQIARSDQRWCCGKTIQRGQASPLLGGGLWRLAASNSSARPSSWSASSPSRLPASSWASHAASQRTWQARSRRRTRSSVGGDCSDIAQLRAISASRICPFASVVEGSSIRCAWARAFVSLQCRFAQQAGKRRLSQQKGRTRPGAETCGRTVRAMRPGHLGRQKSACSSAETLVGLDGVAHGLRPSPRRPTPDRRERGGRWLRR